MQIASHLGKFPEEVLENTPASMLRVWAKYLEWYDENHLEYKYAAAQLAETRRSWVSKPNQIRDEHFKFRHVDNKNVTNDDDIALQNTKNFWLAITGNPQTLKG